jgi:ABC-type Fe3+-hydroxamate transport system substrate-binding protein
MREKKNNTVQFQRIISLVPSQTELLYDLGLKEEVIGITKFCMHPEEWFKSKTRIGGTKNLNIEKIKSLQPDLILANKEENTKDQIEYLQTQFEVYVSDIQGIDDALQMISDIGVYVDKEIRAKEIIDKIQSERRKCSIKKTNLKTIYFIWNDPYMCAGNDTFINAMLNEAGLINIIGETRYPTISIEELKILDPELILLSSEPYPFKQKHVDELSEILPKAKILLVDGELFSWYGSRMCQSFEYFRALNETFF